MSLPKLSLSHAEDLAQDIRQVAAKLNSMISYGHERGMAFDLGILHESTVSDTWPRPFVTVKNFMIV